jgi:hypothetical protein
MANPIVVVNITTTVAPTPATLQQTGALISQGGTVLSPGAAALLTQFSDLTPLLRAAAANTSITWTSNVATVTTTSAHKLPVGEVINLTIIGAAATAYNGTWPCTITGTSTFTYPLLASQSSATVPGSWQPASVNVITQMATTYFSQPTGVAVYVFECGVGDVADGVAFLDAYIEANPNSAYVSGATGYYYAYLVPRVWDGDPNFINMLAQFNATTSQTDFYVTTKLSTYGLYSNLDKCVVALIESLALGQYPANVLTAISWAGAYGANVLTALAWSAANGGTVTASTTTAHGVTPGNVITISGCVPAGYNGTFTALAGTTGSTLVWALAVNPGTETTYGTLVASLQGTVTASTTTAHGVAVDEWFQIAGCLPAGYNGWWQAAQGTTGSTLVFNTSATIGAETMLGTLVASQISNAGVPSTEFSHAAGFSVALNYNPNSLNRVTSFEYAFLYGVTPFPTRNNAAMLATLNTANISYVGTGAEGGISNTILVGGNMLDGNPLNYWYAVDWVAINVNLNVSNFVINGSNDPANPLNYDQDGVNRGQMVAAATVQQGVSYGLVLYPPIQTELAGADYVAALNAGTYNGYSPVNAVPFFTYQAANPGSYKLGDYGGYSVSFVPLRGFNQITFNVNASQIVSA